MTDIPTDVAAIEKIIDAARRPFDITASEQAVLIPEGYELETFVREGVVSEHVLMHDAASFCAYVNRFKTENTQIFANREGRNICAVIDYHSPDGQAAPAAHRCVLELRASDQWRRWTAAAGEEMSQVAFAEFIEENDLDIVEPPAADLLEVVTNIKNRRKVTFQSSIKLSSGEYQVTFAEENEGGKGHMTVPSELVLGIPIFNGGSHYKVHVLLRHRIRDGQIKFVFKLHRREAEERAAFDEIVSGIAEKTKITPYMGST